MEFCTELHMKTKTKDQDEIIPNMGNIIYTWVDIHILSTLSPTSIPDMLKHKTYI